MIEGGWFYVTAAYAVTGAAFAALIAIVLMRARHWARQARRLEKP